ncbi:serine-aspartate repeat-containing protein C isoform X3 [Drosophila kikkawai]
MSTSGIMYSAAKAKSSPAVGHRLQVEDFQQQPITFKLNHDRSLPDTDAADVDVEDQEQVDVEAEEHDDHEVEGEGEEEHEGDNFGEHARELGNDSDGDIKEHVFPLSDNELHPEMHAIEEVQQQLQQQQQQEQDSVAAAPAAEESDSSQQHDSEAEGDNEHEVEADSDSDNESQAPIQASEPLALPSSTESPAAGIEERIKQIAQDFQKMASSQELLQPKEELTPQSSLSLNDLIRTLRPNEQQIIPQIDSDYSNAMRVLGKPLAAHN